MNKTALVLIAMIFFAAACDKSPVTNIAVNPSDQKKTVVVGNARLAVEIADTYSERNQGLSGRESMLQDEGMLFVFDRPGKYGFWMKDMKFALDFIWIRNGKVVEITQNVMPQLGASDSELKTYTPSQDVDQVLEVNAGWTARNSIKAGDLLKE